MLAPKIQRLEMPQALSERSSYCQNPVCLQMSGSRENECNVWADVTFTTYISQSC